MNRIAFIMGDKFLYWNSIILTLAVLAAVILFFALAVRSRENRMAAVFMVPAAFLLSLLFSRFIHWYCRPQGYAGLASAMFDYSRGSFALVGVFAGCLLTAVLLRLFRVSRNLPELLDHMCISGALGISVGRLAALFTSSDRGMLLPDWVPFPFASRLVNSVSGETEVRLAVFLFQSAIAGILFLVLLCTYLRGKRKNTLRDGDTCLIFLLWYCGSQAVLDSPRYDSLYFRSNGFVSVVQIFGALTVLLVLIIFSVRLVKCRRWSKFYMPLLCLPLLGLAGYMEYHVQRHGGEALFAYSVMSVSMLGVILLTLGIRANAVPVRQYSAPEAVSEPPAFDPYEYDDNLSSGEEAYSEAEEETDSWDYTAPAQPRRGRKGRYQGKFSSRRS